MHLKIWLHFLLSSVFCPIHLSSSFVFYLQMYVPRKIINKCEKIATCGLLFLGVYLYAEFFELFFVQVRRGIHHQVAPVASFGKCHYFANIRLVLQNGNKAV